MGTIIFYIVTGGKGNFFSDFPYWFTYTNTDAGSVPSYVGSSFGFIGVVVSATGYNYVPSGPGNARADVAVGGILVCGLVYGAIGLVIFFLGHNWINYVMPPGKVRRNKNFFTYGVLN